ncbi:unnamed protein product [Arabidopsis halleri]
MLGLDDPEIFIPYYAYAEAVTRNRLSLIARPLNPRVQNLQTVVSSLPRSWGLATRVHGRVLDATYVQFLFQSEIDLLSIQRREPWVFNNWFVAMQRVNAPESERIGHFRDGLNDEFHRSDMNSQSQNSDLSFPASISQYPRAVTPPLRVNRPSLNTEELEAACPHFQSSSFQNVRHLDRPIPQYPSRRYSSVGSSSSSHSVNEAISPISRQFEVGESSKGQEYKKGGNQMPPKKR